jgi:hypothetical protein
VYQLSPLCYFVIDLCECSPCRTYFFRHHRLARQICHYQLFRKKLQQNILPKNSTEVSSLAAHNNGQLYKKAMPSRAPAQVQNDKAVLICSYAVGDRVLIYYTPGETESGRKLRVPWIGPYRITERHSAVGYSAVSKWEGKTARVHVTHLKAIPDGRKVDTSAPEQGLWPDVRRVL